MSNTIRCNTCGAFMDDSELQELRKYVSEKEAEIYEMKNRLEKMEANIASKNKHIDELLEENKKLENKKVELPTNPIKVADMLIYADICGWKPRRL